MSRRVFSALCLFFLAAGLLAAAFAAWQRYRVESGFRTVEVAMVYDDLANLAALSGKDTLEVMRLFREQGLTTVLFKEPTLEELKATGEVSALTGQDLLNLQPPWLGSLRAQEEISSRHTYLVTSREETARRLALQLEAKAGGARVFRPAPGVFVVRVPASPSNLQKIGLGFPEGPLRDSARAGLFAAVQVRAWPGASARSMEKALSPLKDIPNLSAVAFNDDTLPGYPAELGALARTLEGLGVPVVQVEFFRQRGLEKLGVLLQKRVVRLHTIKPEEMPRYTPKEARNRYLLAAAERNARMLLVRPLADGTGAGSVLRANLDFVAGLREGLYREGLVVGRASLLPPLPVSRPLVFVMGLGVIAGGLLLLQRLGLERGLPLLGLAAALAWGGLLAAAPSPARKLAALAAVVVFPTLSLLTTVRPRGAPLPECAARLVLAVSLSFPGALFTVGLLADAGFMLKLDQFWGVKPAHVLPLLLAAIAFFFLYAPPEPWHERLSRTLQRPVLVKWAAAGALLLAVLAVYLVRTGNEGEAVTSALELKARNLLDALLGVRPRTKEFLLGHPLLMLLFATGYRDNRYLPLLILGAVGQISLVNTFAHIHTPLAVSLLRLFYGLALGLLVGAVLVLAVRAAARCREKMVPPGEGP
ncbi:DUF5693 family protein [Desulfovirgula thermocuniculi]|uniref:DUF5693 family protein n=1 Tax=Desulfovirgula thermocuniculi TaxID=348842 RepID=UPI000685A4F7|nr:DUF5693 family protein [Desulfovirgula thermocuniculi]